MKRHYINLKPFFNKRHVYPASTILDPRHPYYVEECFKFGEVEGDGVFAYLTRNQDMMDNMNCADQVIEIDDLFCDRIVILGTCCWGIYKEQFELRFSDGTIEYADAKFYDWYWPAEPAIKASFDLEAKEFSDYNHIFAKFVKRDNEKEYCFMYYYKTDLKIKGRKLKQIVFPDNMFMNIFAITLEVE